MELKVLGSSGSSLPKHKLTSFLINGIFLFDAGTVTSALSFDAQLKIKYIFITHAHLDHIQDIPYLLDNLFLAGVNHKISLFSLSEVIKYMRKNLFNSQLWPDFSVIPDPERAILLYSPLNFYEMIELDNLRVTLLPSKHTVTSCAFLIENKNSRILYTGDTTYNPEIWNIYGSYTLDTLITEISLPNRMENLASITGHLTPSLLFKGLSHFQIQPKRILLYHLKAPYRKEILRDLKKINLSSMEILKEGKIYYL